jgi:hypothetical protein
VSYHDIASTIDYWLDAAGRPTIPVRSRFTPMEWHQIIAGVSGAEHELE